VWFVTLFYGVSSVRTFSFTYFSRSYCSMQYDRLLASYCRRPICPSVFLWRCALWLNDAFYSKNVRTSERELSPPTWTRFYNFQTPTPTLFSQTSYLMNNGRWCHLANKLKPYCEEAQSRNFLCMEYPSSACRTAIPDNAVRSAHS